MGFEIYVSVINVLFLKMIITTTFFEVEYVLTSLITFSDINYASSSLRLFIDLYDIKSSNHFQINGNITMVFVFLPKQISTNVFIGYSSV